MEHQEKPMEHQTQPTQQININLEDVWKILVQRSQADKELALHLEVVTHAAIAQDRANQLAGVESKMRDHLNQCVINTEPTVPTDDPVWPSSKPIGADTTLSSLPLDTET